MAFVEIYRGSIVKRVPQSVFEAQYQGLGYRIKKHDPVREEVREEVKEEVRERVREEHEPDVDTVPLSEMTQKQLKEYAQRHNIDISKANSAREARNIIRKAVQEG